MEFFFFFQIIEENFTGTHSRIAITSYVFVQIAFFTIWKRNPYIPISGLKAWNSLSQIKYYSIEKLSTMAQLS
jgi:hypothetical protein